MGGRCPVLIAGNPLASDLVGAAAAILTNEESLFIAFSLCISAGEFLITLYATS